MTQPTPAAFEVSRYVPDEVRRLIGDDLARRFLTRFGGTTVPFPVSRSGTWFERIVRLIGPGPTEKLCRRYEGEKVYIPLGKGNGSATGRHADVVARLAAGESMEAVAAAYGITVRHVRRIRAGAREKVAA